MEIPEPYIEKFWIIMSGMELSNIYFQQVP